MHWGVVLLFTSFTTIAWAQTPAPAAPAPAAPAPAAPAPPAPSTAPAPTPAPGQPPQYYYPAPGYAYPPPAAYQPPEELPYKEGAPIPVGYHEEERPRKGLVIAGWIITAIPYGIGVMAAASADFKNQSGWMAVPFAGPWLTMGRRDYVCEDNDGTDNDTDEKNGLACLGEVFLVMGLIVDGVMQAAGGTLLLIGYANPKKHVVRDGVSLNVRPMRLGTGQGLGLTGTF